MRVKTERAFVVPAADAAHLYNHFEERRVFLIVDNVACVLEGYDLLERPTSREHVTLGHGPAVPDRSPAADPRIQDWVARLDAAPKRS